MFDMFGKTFLVGGFLLCCTGRAARYEVVEEES